jgi:hypothetical protein
VLLASGVLFAVTEGEKMMASVVLCKIENCVCANMKDKIARMKKQEQIQNAIFRTRKTFENKYNDNKPRNTVNSINPSIAHVLNEKIFIIPLYHRIIKKSGIASILSMIFVLATLRL